MDSIQGEQGPSTPPTALNKGVKAGKLGNRLTTKLQNINPKDLAYRVARAVKGKFISRSAPASSAPARPRVSQSQKQVDIAQENTLQEAQALSQSIRDQSERFTEYQQKIYQIYHEAYSSLADKKSLSPEEAKSIRNSLSQSLSTSKRTFELQQQQIFNDMKKNAGRLIKQSYNQDQLTELEAEIEKINLQTSLTEMATSTNRLLESAVASFEGVFEKKMFLLEELHGNQKPKHLKELDSSPTRKDLLNVSQLILSNENKTSKNLSPSEAKAEIKQFEKTLKWGDSHLVLARSNPSTWTPLNRLSLKFSRTGKLHASVSEMIPIIKSNKMTPAGLRSREGFNKHPTNFHMTKTYLLKPDGSPQVNTVVTSFRGGQFPTKEAAKEALEFIIDNTDSNDLHINSLLTPTALTVLKKDRKLLQIHSENIKKALDELLSENQGTDLGRRIEEIKDNYTLSNFGVNEGGVGLKKILGKKMILGWHHATKNYNNEAMLANNKRIQSRIETDPQNLKNLGAIVKVSQEMEKIWAQNDFAKGGVGDDQFKMAVLQLTLCKLLNVPYYVHCMSGKDRTGSVESLAQAYYDEIMMDTMDHPVDLSMALNINTVLEALGLEEGGPGLFQKKKVASKWLPDTKGISTNKPLINNPNRKTKASLLSGIKLPTFYDETPSIGAKIRNREPLDKEYEKKLEQLHRQQINKRMSLFSGGITNTLRNTGFAGYKIKGGEPLRILTSGFNRDYVLLKTLTSPDGAKAFSQLTNLKELSDKDRKKIEDSVNSILENTSFSTKKKFKRLTKVLKQVEGLKFETIQPQTKVAS